MSQPRNIDQIGFVSANSNPKSIYKLADRGAHPALDVGSNIQRDKAISQM